MSSTQLLGALGLISAVIIVTFILYTGWLVISVWHRIDALHDTMDDIEAKCDQIIGLLKGWEP